MLKTETAIGGPAQPSVDAPAISDRHRHVRMQARRDFRHTGVRSGFGLQAFHQPTAPDVDHRTLPIFHLRFYFLIDLRILSSGIKTRALKRPVTIYLSLPAKRRGVFAYQ
jgi:hypothetical protein